MKKPVALLIVLLLIGGILFLGLYPIDDVIVSGGGYGFRIGETKQQCIERASMLETPLYTVFLQSSAYQGLVKLSFADDQKKLLDEVDVWVFWFHENPHRNILRLHFENGRLAKISRVRQLFEFP